MEIHLHNTLTGQKEAFKPLKKGFLGLGRPQVGMYHCGPTVYHYPHIGNLRAYVFADTLKRLMKASGYKVEQVINITDVGHLVSDSDTGEDKMTKASRRENKSAWEVAEFYTKAFFQDLHGLNIDTSGTHFPRATQYIPQQIKLVRMLEKKGFTYKTQDGIYFDTAKFPNYGKLGNIDIKGLREGERIGVNDEKRNPTDFALWKFSPKNEKRDMEWDSPWGVGFPGWHIECSAMATDILGIPVDIHTGGIDHIPVHHNNEIAQSEAATGKQFVRYWMHSAFVNIEGDKMAKSGENFLTLDGLTKILPDKSKRFVSTLYRYYLLLTHYSKPINFNIEAFKNLQATLEGLVRSYSELDRAKGSGKPNKEYVSNFLTEINDDLNTPKALAILFTVLHRDTKNLTSQDKKATIDCFDTLLGLELAELVKENNTVEIPPKVLLLAKQRESAKSQKNYTESDRLREEILKAGYRVIDTPKEQKIVRK